MKCKPNIKNGNKGITAYYIKYFLLMSAAGKTAPPIFLLADDKMDKDAIDIHQIYGLSSSTSPDEFSYVVFTKTRSGNAALFRWMTNLVLIDFVNKIRNHLRPEVKNSQAWYQIDGELAQINVFKEDAIKQLMVENNIVVGKFPGSTTEINQPADQKPFKACKGTLKRINDNTVAHCVDDLFVLEEMIESHESKCRSKIDYSHRRYMTYGLLRVRTALQFAIRNDLLINSFHDTGIFPFNMDRMISNCKVLVPDATRLIWSQNLEANSRTLKFHERYQKEKNVPPGISNLDNRR